MVDTRPRRESPVRPGTEEWNEAIKARSQSAMRTTLSDHNERDGRSVGTMLATRKVGMASVGQGTRDGRAQAAVQRSSEAASTSISRDERREATLKRSAEDEFTSSAGHKRARVEVQSDTKLGDASALRAPARAINSQTRFGRMIAAEIIPATSSIMRSARMVDNTSTFATRNRDPGRDSGRKADFQPRSQKAQTEHLHVHHKCFSCDQTGHFARDCPNNNSKKCYTCGGPHLKKHCKNRNITVPVGRAKEGYRTIQTVAATRAPGSEIQSEDAKIALITKCLGLGLKSDMEYYTCLRWLWNQDLAALEREHSQLQLKTALRVKQEPKEDSRARHIQRSLDAATKDQEQAAEPRLRPYNVEQAVEDEPGTPIAEGQDELNNLTEKESQRWAEIPMIEQEALEGPEEDAAGESGDDQGKQSEAGTLVTRRDTSNHLREVLDSYFDDAKEQTPYQFYGKEDGYCADREGW
jgi:hypothetical protein